MPSIKTVEQYVKFVGIQRQRQTKLCYRFPEKP